MSTQRFSIVIALALTVVLNLDAEGAGQAASPQKAGQALLDSFISTFLGLAKSDSDGGLERDLPKMMAAAKRARQERQIDLVFFTRYTRLLTIFRLAGIPDPEEILRPVLEKEASSFIRDTIGQDIANANIADQLAAAAKEEILDLQLYLDNSAAKAKLRREFDTKFKDAVWTRK